MGDALSLRPFLGVKGGWIHQTIHNEMWNPIDLPFTKAREDLKNNFWGVGPSGGLNTKWVLACGESNDFSLFGDFSGALMWAQWNFKDQYKNNAPQEVIIDLPKIKGGAFMLRSFMGFGWDCYFSCFHLSARLGYEMQFWLDQLQLVTLNVGRIHDELTFQGGTLDVRFEF